MEVYDTVNKILKDKNLTKREFAKVLQNLQPKLKSTGETPLETTIYKYLNGQVSIPIELIPYIAEALDITEQELFENTKYSRKKCIKYVLESSDEKELNYFNTIINSKITNSNINYGSIIITEKNKSKKLQELIELFEHVPDSFIDKVLIKFREYKRVGEEF
jgi:transcriptional regulator with XRE-family HTH domain